MVPASNAKHFRLKAAQRDLIAAAGGIERAALPGGGGVMALTQSESEAMCWLREHGGDGVFADRSHQVLYARSESAPFMRSTWNSLERKGQVEFYDRRRCRIRQAPQ